MLTPAFTEVVYMDIEFDANEIRTLASNTIMSMIRKFNSRPSLFTG